jgi:hypothetical protein
MLSLNYYVNNTLLNNLFVVHTEQTKQVFKRWSNAGQLHDLIATLIEVGI